MKEELKQFGLTENESKVYLALAELGDSTATPIRNKSDLHTSRVYEALNSLIEKGMVSYFLKNNVKHFRAANPDVMFDILDEKRENLLSVVPQIKMLKEKKDSTYSVSLYEGYKSLKQLYDHVLFNLKSGSEILVLGAEQETKHFVGRTFFKEYTKRRIKRKIKMRILFNDDAKETAKIYSKESFTEARVLPKGTKVPSALDIYPKKISMLVLNEKPLVFHIDCKEVADSYKQYFEFLWRISSKI